MNEIHLHILSSPEWAQTMRDELLSWPAATHELGDDVLELGPGPGLTTNLLATQTMRVTAVELDEQLARDLATRTAGTNVTVLCADATDTGFEAARFSSVVCLSMLHHVPSRSEQDQVIREAFRVLRPGGCFIALDALDSEAMRELHVDDVFVPFDPDSATERLTAAGFRDIEIERATHRIRVFARKV